MFKNQMHERFNPGTDLTAIATTAVTGKTFVAYAGKMQSGLITVKPATPGGHIAGVAKYDAPTPSDRVGVARGSSRIVTVTAATPLTAGSPIEVGADGKATTAASGVIVGWCVDDAKANTDALISLAN